jgi:predicted Zn-dependent protease
MTRSIALVILVAFAGCPAAKQWLSDPKNLDKVVKVGKKVASLAEEIRPDQEYYVGRSVATNILARNEYRYLDKKALSDGRLTGVTEYVNQIGNLLAAAALETKRKGDRPAPVGGWRFVVIESDEINAYAGPGGWVFVTTGAIRAAKSEDELACILAHEIAHVVRGHALGNIKKSRYADVGADVLQAAGTAALSPEQVEQLNGLMEGLIEDTMDAIFVKGYSRDTEYEADKLAVELTLAAGYKPIGLVNFLETLRGQQDTGKGGVFATHPKADDRLARIQKQIAGKKLADNTVPAVRVERFAARTKSLR